MIGTGYTKAETCISAAEAYFRRYQLQFHESVSLERRITFNGDNEFTIRDFFDLPSPSQSINDHMYRTGLKRDSSVISSETDDLAQQARRYKSKYKLRVVNEETLFETYRQLEVVVKTAYTALEEYKSSLFSTKDKLSALFYRLHVVEKEATGSMEWLMIFKD